MITIHKPEDFVGMRKAGKLAAEVLDFITDHVNPGVSTNYLNDLCHQYIINAGAIPAPLNYRGYPKSICTSKNRVVCHGIPDDTPLKEGDIVNLDVTVELDGWFGDTSRTYLIGRVAPNAKRLTECAYYSMMAGIESAKPGAKLSEVCMAIYNYAYKFGYSTVRDYCGHGIGRVFHAPPNVANYYRPQDDKVILQPGMFFTVEPMVNEGKADTILSKFDGWTVTTRDLKLSAQFEHTIAITESGYEIFTLSTRGYTLPPYN